MPAAARAHAATPARRQAILEAALAVFLEHGVAAASIDEIRARSGASVGSIYHHFAGKEGLAAALYNDTLADYQAGLLRVLEATADTRAGIEGAVRHHLRWVVEHPDRARYLLAGTDARAALAGRRDLREQNRRFFARVNSWLAPRLAAGELRRVSPEVLHALWIGPSQELARHWLEGRVKRRPTEDAEVLAAAAWDALSN
jgi:AcrR family transcriptional regulator